MSARDRFLLFPNETRPASSPEQWRRQAARAKFHTFFTSITRRRLTRNHFSVLARGSKGKGPDDHQRHP